MRELSIAYGMGREAKQWYNKTVKWEDLLRQLKTTRRTRETVAQYHAMTKPQKDNIKNGRGFVMGRLKDGVRTLQNVEYRSGITADADEAKPDFLQRFLREWRYTAAVYTTHGHTPEKPRLRIVVPLTRDISADEYTAISRYFADMWGMEQFDACSFRANQLMYFPSTPKNGEFLFETMEGPWLDPDAFLADHPDWRDCAALPTAAREKKPYTGRGKGQQDPLQKTGTVGAFCRTYSIEDAIETFLSGVYEPCSVPDRYTYIPGESTAGLVVYEHKFAYSHHATDPANGQLCNAFDLVRIHKFGDGDGSFQAMCAFAEDDERVKRTIADEKTAQAQKDFAEITSSWEPPIPLEREHGAPFPADALPDDIGAYVKAVAESTQTPIDMAGCAALAVIAVCTQGKYRVMGKADWTEPLNCYFLVISPPSERKSAVEHCMVRTLDEYEQQYNLRNAPAVEASKMQKRVLERRQKAIEEHYAKGKAARADLDDIAAQIANFKEETPLRLYVDDVTVEKLVSVMAKNGGKAAIISGEGGIFDALAGIYTKNVNIDVMLKGYSGDPIRVDRIGRESEVIPNPALTLFLMAQPNVLAEVMRNPTFRGRGLTARFLYSCPESYVGERRFDSAVIDEEIYHGYERKIVNMLDDPRRGEMITLSPGAAQMLKAFSDETEPRLKGDLSEMSDWAGKLVGNTLRIAGLLCRADVLREDDFAEDTRHLEADENVMRRAIELGEYFLSHAKTVYTVMPANSEYNKALRVLLMIKDKNLTEFDRRTAMRNCRSFRTADEIQPVLDFLEDYGYIAALPRKYTGTGRPPQPKYAVNPLIP